LVQVEDKIFSSNREEDSSLQLRADPEIYSFASKAEADATYLVIAWFAITESAALGIFPIHAALGMGHSQGAAYITRFFEQSFRHFRDEQRHANLWCQALLEFAGRYPEVIKRVKLPDWLLGVMLKSVGKPHNVRQFAVDCLAFETVMRAFYDVAHCRLNYPPLQPIFQVIMRDEQKHTDFGQSYIFELEGPLLRRERAGVAFRYWRNLAGVLITIQPLLKALDKHKTLPYQEFSAQVAGYVQETGIAGSHKLVPGLLKHLPL